MVNVSKHSSFKLSERRCVTLVIGPMGAGKTTITRLLTAKKEICYDTDDARKGIGRKDALLKEYRRKAVAATSSQKRTAMWQKHNEIWFSAVGGGLSTLLAQNRLNIAMMGMFCFDHGGWFVIENGISDVLKKTIVHLDAPDAVLEKRLKDRYEFIASHNPDALGGSSLPDYLKMAKTSADSTRHVAGVWKTLGFNVTRLSTDNVLAEAVCKSLIALAGGDDRE